MKKVALILMMISSYYVYCQQSKEYLKLKATYEYDDAYVITLDSIRINGLIRTGLMSEQYSVVDFVHLDGSKKKYKPKNILGFGYSVFNFISIDDKFYRVVLTGNKVSLYKEVIPAKRITVPVPVNGYGIMASVYFDEKQKVFVKKPGETVFHQVVKQNFKEIFSDYFSGCKKLELKILNGQLVYTDIETIVREYNYCY